MSFNVDKCKVIHFGNKNLGADYSIGSQLLGTVDEECDLGVVVQNDLKVTNQCKKVVKTANRILGMIYRNITYRSKDIILQLYKSLVRPHLEYCVQAWRPHLQKDIIYIEKVQKRATKLIDSLRKIPYEQRLQELHLTTLETRRLRGDLIEVFKILKGFDKVSKSKFFLMSGTSLRGHSLKLFKSRFNTNTGKFVFTNRIVDEWNLLSEEIISCVTVNDFKNKLDLHLRSCRGFI